MVLVRIQALGEVEVEHALVVPLDEGKPATLVGPDIEACTLVEKAVASSMSRTGRIGVESGVPVWLRSQPAQTLRTFTSS